MNPALLSSKHMGWETPESVLGLVRLVAPIALDPCTTEVNPTNAARYFTPREDGLRQSWVCGGLVYVNCPFGRALPRWADKCVQEADRGAEIILLVPARTDTKWATRLFDKADAVAFWRGRMRFKGAPASAPFPTMLIYFGERYAKFGRTFAPHAAIWYPV